MPTFLISRRFAIAVSLFCALSLHSSAAASPVNGTGRRFAIKPEQAAPPPACKIVYAGFVGALETSNHKRSGVVQIRDVLRGADYADVCASTFIPVSWTSGRDWILTHFPSHAGPLTPRELLSAPRLIMVGHSTGGWAMLSVARDLRAKNIPIDLTVQIDSVGFADYTIPKNVSSAAIFHAWDLLSPMTTKHLKLEDPQHSKIVADVLVKDASHISITRDPRIRQLVLDAIATLRKTIAARSNTRIALDP